PGRLGAGQICRHGDFAGLDHDGRVVWRRADRVHRGTAVPRLDRGQPVPATRVRLGQSPAGADLPPAAWAAPAGRPGTVADAARRLRGRAGVRVAARKVGFDPRAVDPARGGERRDRVDRGGQDRGLSHETAERTTFQPRCPALRSWGRKSSVGWNAGLSCRPRQDSAFVSSESSVPAFRRMQRGGTRTCQNTSTIPGACMKGFATPALLALTLVVSPGTAFAADSAYIEFLWQPAPRNALARGEAFGFVM